MQPRIAPVANVLVESLVLIEPCPLFEQLKPDKKLMMIAFLGLASRDGSN